MGMVSLFVQNSDRDGKIYDFFCECQVFIYFNLSAFSFGGRGRFLSKYYY